MGRRYLLHALSLLVLLAFQTGCDPVGRQRFLTTFFNEVPTFPPVEQYCQEAEEKKERELALLAKKAVAGAPVVYKSSIHQPYEEKRCNGCHQEEKTSISGLLKPETELCFMCHPGILKSALAHGPAAEGNCLACHLPHEASYPSLLAVDPGKVCDKCHSEQRLAQEMHDRIKATGLLCQDCHDPHSGAARYFLK